MNFPFSFKYAIPGIFNVLPIKVIYDMETNDPDDAFTLCLLASHPRIDLKAITITPGSPYQVGIVKHILKKLENDIPVGVYKPDYHKNCVSYFHYKWLGEIGPAKHDGKGCDVLKDIWEPDVIPITGGPLGNLQDFLKYKPKFKTMVIQGGFAGDNIVPSEYRLDKFAGKIICPTFNFNANINAAKDVLAYNDVERRFLVSKNVCHGVCYDQELHEQVGKNKDSYPGLSMIYKGMEIYLNKKPTGKLFHDLLAACVAIDKDICNFKEVEIYREKGQWGSRLKDNSKTFISISVDKDKFKKTLIAKNW